MTDSFPPPDTAAPPPATPPGYAAYTPTRWGEGLSRVQSLSTWISILLVITVIGSVASIPLALRVSDAAEDYLAGGISDDEFRDEINSNMFGGAIVSAVGIALVVLSIVWLYRIVRNHRAFGRQLRWGPGWAIGGWFLPPFVLYIIPLLVLRESWQASDPESPAGSTTWKQNSADDARLWGWWLLYGLSPILFLVVGVSQVTTIGRGLDDIAEVYVDQRGFVIAQSIVTIAAAVAWFLVVRTLTGRHTQLTEEASSRR